MDLSGPAATHGQRQLQGAQYMASRLGVDLLVEDTGGMADQAASAVHKLVGSGVSGLVGPSTAFTLETVASAAGEAGIPLVMPLNSASHAMPNVFTSGPSNDQLAELTFADLRRHELHGLALLVQESLATGLARFRGQAAAAGMTIVHEATFPHSATDVTAQLTELVGKEPAAIIVFAVPPHNSMAAVGARAIGWNGPMYFSPSAAQPLFLQAAGKAAEGIRVVAPWAVAAKHVPDGLPNAQLIRQFAEDFTAFSGTAVGSFVAYAADAVQLLVHAFATTSDPGIASRVLERVGNIGVTGVQVMTPENHLGLLSGGLAVLTVKDGDWHPL